MTEKYFIFLKTSLLIFHSYYYSLIMLSCPCVYGGGVEGLHMHVCFEFTMSLMSSLRSPMIWLKMISWPIRALVWSPEERQQRGEEKRKGRKKRSGGKKRREKIEERRKKWAEENKSRVEKREKKRRESKRKYKKIWYKNEIWEMKWWDRRGKADRRR